VSAGASGGVVLVVTDRGQARAAGHDLADVVAAALDGGAREVLLRDKDLPPPERRRLAEALRARTAAAGAALHVAGDAGLARAVGADGVHLAAADPWPVDAERAGLVVGRSCHTLAELAAALAEGADRATYSPVYATASKPGYGPALGIDGLAAGCRAVPGLAVLALGGVDPTTARACVEAGAAGVAVMGGIMRAADPAAAVRALVRAVGAATGVRAGTGAGDRAGDRRGGEVDGQDARDGQVGVHDARSATT
jgi:thiamine-phosphate pyrophosphorylase